MSNYPTSAQASARGQKVVNGFFRQWLSVETRQRRRKVRRDKLRAFDEDFILRNEWAKRVSSFWKKRSWLDGICVDVDYCVIANMFGLREDTRRRRAPEQQAAAKDPPETPVELDDEPPNVFLREDRFPFA
jgi:hypothetical protein